MQAQCQWHEEHQCIWAHPSPKPMLHTSPDIGAVSDDDSSFNCSPYVKVSESEGGIWSDQPNVADDYTHDCDLVGPNVVEPNPDP